MDSRYPFLRQKKAEPTNPAWWQTFTATMYCSSECQNPEAIIAMLNWVCEGYADPTPGNAFYEKYNELAQDAEIGAAGANNLMPFQMASNTNWGEVFEEAIANGEDHVDGKDADYQKVISTEVDEATSWTFNKIYLEGYQALDFEHIRYSDYMGAPTETSTKKQSILDDEKLKTYIAMIMGETSTDSFGDFMAKYRNWRDRRSAKKSRHTWKSR